AVEVDRHDGARPLALRGERDLRAEEASLAGVVLDDLVAPLVNDRPRVRAGALVALLERGLRALADLVELEVDRIGRRLVLDHAVRADVLPLLRLDRDALGLEIGEEARRVEDLERAREVQVERLDRRDLLRDRIVLRCGGKRDWILAALGT